MGERIRLMTRGLDVAKLHWALLEHPELWNTRTARTDPPESPHHGLDDIWVRFVEATGDGYAEGPCVWTEAAKVLGIRKFCLDVMRGVGGTELGGVLITRIPPFTNCKPHTDEGWHAAKYQKFGVQVASAPGQGFCFEDDQLVTQPGDVFWFDNSYTHWVVNETPYERITLIVCARVED